MSADVFVSYSRGDQVYVQRLVAFLREQGLPVWHDSEIDYGRQWQDVIVQHIASCAAFVVIMSVAAAESLWVKREINEALAEGKTIMPLLLSGNRPFFSVNHLNYEDVRDGSLPSGRFIGLLRRRVSETAAQPESTPTPFGSPSDSPFEVSPAAFIPVLHQLESAESTLIACSGETAGQRLFHARSAKTQINRYVQTVSHGRSLEKVGAFPARPRIDMRLADLIQVSETTQHMPLELVSVAPTEVNASIGAMPDRLLDPITTDLATLMSNQLRMITVPSCTGRHLLRNISSCLSRLHPENSREISNSIWDLLMNWGERNPQDRDLVDALLGIDRSPFSNVDEPPDAQPVLIDLRVPAPASLRLFTDKMAPHGVPEAAARSAGPRRW